MKVSFFRQLLRGKGRLLLSILLLCAVTAFFVMSTNLCRSSQENLVLAEETFSTIAVMELYADIDGWGNLTPPSNPDYEGNFSVAAEGYDLTPVTTATGVESYDLRSRYAAYIPRQPIRKDSGTYIESLDYIRFQVLTDEPVSVRIYLDDNASILRNYEQIPVEILHSAAGVYSYRKQIMFHLEIWEEARLAIEEDLRRFNQAEITDRIILYPGVEYYAMGSVDSAASSMGFFSDGYGEKYRVQYSAYTGRELRFSIDRNGRFTNPFFIWRWEDVQSDPVLLEYFTEAEQALQYSLCSYCAILTNDVEGVLPFHLGGALLSEGRFITPEEYASGAKVCMVSQKMAQKRGWSVGDRLELNFWETGPYPYNFYSMFPSAFTYTKDSQGFFDRGEYEIVGTYTSRELVGNSTISESALSLPWFTIYVPEKSVNGPIAKENLPVHGNLLTIRLKNGSVNAFLDDLSAKGLLEQKEGNYQPRFTFYDQGYSLIQPGLVGMRGTAGLLLGISAALLAATVILLAYFFAHSQKHSVGIFRMLGGGKASAFAAVLACGLALALVGAAIGGILGHSLSGLVGDRILAENLSEGQQAAKFSAYLLAGGEKEIALSAGADGWLTLLSAAAGAGLFLLCTAVFILLYLRKEPRALLPGKE